jgi:coatomer protein complex subunit alpha (xenin)
LKSDDRVVLYDQQARKAIAELQIPRVKYVVWNKDFSMVALVSKHQLVLANKQLEQLCTVTETVRLKGGCWDDTKPVFIYTTLNHVKYLLQNGDKGIVRGLDAPVYVTKVQSNTLSCLDREGKMRTMDIDTTEAMFKLALERKDYSEVMRMVKHSRLCGQAIISYLTAKGYPEVALNFVHDNKTRFKLALACGNIQVAMNVAYDLGDEAWRQLGVEALRQGNHEVVEMSYQKTKEFERLSFLYLLTGNTEKLRKMLKIAEMRGDAMSRFHNALFLGDAEERVKVLESTNQLSLAYITAATHGMEADAARLLELLEVGKIPVPVITTGATLLQPPTPILRGENWPLLAVGKSLLSDIKDKTGVSAIRADGDEEFQDAKGGQWGDDDDDLFDDEDADQRKKAPDGPKEGGQWGDDDDLDLSDDEAPSPAKGTSGKGTDSGGGAFYAVPSGGVVPTVGWCADSAHAADHLAAGSAESALNLLHRQIAVANAEPLKANALSLFIGACAFLPGFPLLPSNRSYLTRETIAASAASKSVKSMPALSLKVTVLLEQLKVAYRAFTNGQFAECRTSFDAIITSIPLVHAASRTETTDLKELLEVSREYITAIRVKNAITESTADIPRSLELVSYFTHCNLQPAHLVLALKTAMASAFKNKNYINAAGFARRLLELPDMSSERNAESRSKAQKVLQKSEQQGRNEFPIDYDEMNPFTLDCFTFKPVYKGSASVKCSYCSSLYVPTCSGKLCVTCNLCTVGIVTVGLVTQANPAGRNK